MKWIRGFSTQPVVIRYEKIYLCLSWTCKLNRVWWPNRAIVADASVESGGVSIESSIPKTHGEFLDPEKNSPPMIPKCCGFRNGDRLSR